MPKIRHGAEYYSVSELADKLGVHRNSVIYWINTGKINATKLGLAPKSPFYIEAEEVERIEEELELDSN